MKCSPLCLLTASVLLSAAAHAQPVLIGLTARQMPASSNLTRQSFCNATFTACANALSAPTARYAGGAAYSPMRRSVWHSNGTALAEVMLDGCSQPCLMRPTLTLGANSRVSGLTINPARREMYQLETIAGTAAIATYVFSEKERCPKFRSACKIALPGRAYFAGAIAFDAQRDLIFVATSLFDVAIPQSRVLVYRRGDPNCTRLCIVNVTTCATFGLLQAIKAMAYDECQDMLYISDGRQTSRQRVLTAGTCPALVPMACCPLNHPQGETWWGFDIESFHPRQLGSSCTARPCPNCNTMRLAAVGDAALGNLDFGLRIENGPAGALGLVFLSGSCTAGIPLGCGRFHPSLPPLLLPPLALTGAAPCGGQGTVPLPIPNNVSLCNGLLCAQGIVLCLNSPPLVGIGLTNALVIPIGS